MPLQPGYRIERYVIEAPLGRGGMGAVYRARDERLQRSVALKILRLEATATGLPSSAPSTEGSARLLREARAAAALDHPNVVAIFDVGQIDEPEELRGTTYLAMELIKGKPLRAYVGHASVTIDERIQWLVQIAQALGAAHTAGLVHRDVKPENVMIREDRRVKVLDFGIAKRSASDAVEPTSTTEGLVLPTLTAQGVTVGTPMYMAPEQLRAERLDGRVDQFAWGVVGYELLTGKLPWSTEAGAITLVSQILSATPPPVPPELGVPPHVAAAVLRALSKDRADRFASMDALVLALDATRGAVSTLASPLAQSSYTPVPPAGASAKIPTPVAAAKAPTSGRSRLLALTGVAIIAASAWAMGIRGNARKPAAEEVSVGGRDAESLGCSNRACTAQHGGEPYVCRASDHACVPIASPDCTPKFEPEDLARDDTVWFGAMFPLKGEAGDTYGKMNMEGADLARAEIAQALTSLGAATAPRGVRRVALVECDDGEDAMRVARHLVDDVGVPGILGFHSGQEVIDLSGRVLIPRGVVAVASTTSNPLITRLPQPPDQPRLVWRTTFNYESLAEATAGIVSYALEPRDKSGRPTRLSLVRDSVIHSTFAEAFYKAAVINGKPARDSGHDYQEIVLDSDGGVNAGEAARLLEQAQPSIVVFLARNDECLAIVEALETSLPASARRPVYVLALSDASVLAPFIGSSEERRHRAFGVVSSSSSTANARFVIRYNQARRVPVTRSFNPSSSYDAFYLLAYASFALPPGERVTGVALARSFARLLGPGKSIEAGPMDIFGALDLLSSGKTIDLEGVTSALDFDPSTGEAPSDFSLDCPAVDEHGLVLHEDVESGVTYLAKAHKTEGALRCP